MTHVKQHAAPLDITRILEILPHRYPFVLVDRILEIGEGHIVGQKCVTANEWFFPGHFPRRPVMPGVLMLEAMAQTGALLIVSEPENMGRMALLVGVDDARFRRIVTPGDVLRIEVKEIARKRSFGRIHGRILVDDNLACEATISFSIDQTPAREA